MDEALATVAKSTEDELLAKVAESVTEEDVARAKEASASMRETSADAKTCTLQLFAADQG